MLSIGKRQKQAWDFSSNLASLGSVLAKLLEQSQYFGFDYIEQVLYPELFISWIQSAKGCSWLETDSFYQNQSAK